VSGENASIENKKSKKNFPTPCKFQKLSPPLQKITERKMRFNTKYLDVLPEILERERERGM
jgi:hypothetical protein